ncbi:NADH-quinone oxidoreductase subunit NuoE [Candidatus Poribacteria bacterium]|nr:NADH-quinone oxidoreductase subunit NuoE [Candidatus Poribacteria bacterium]
MEKVVEEVLNRHNNNTSILSVLKDVQEKCRYLPEEAISQVAEGLGVSINEVYEVATFYSFLSTGLLGENVIRICKSTPCFLKSCDVIVETVEKELGIGIGQTTEDNKFSLQLTNCIGACDKAPAMMINDKIYGNLTSEKVIEILKEYK